MCIILNLYCCSIMDSISLYFCNFMKNLPMFRFYFTYKVSFSGVLVIFTLTFAYTLFVVNRPLKEGLTLMNSFYSPQFVPLKLKTCYMHTFVSLSVSLKLNC